MYIVGASIRACRHIDRNLVTFEKDNVIFIAVLAPLRNSQPSHVVGGSQFLDMDNEDEEELVQNIPQNSRSSM